MGYIAQLDPATDSIVGPVDPEVDDVLPIDAIVEGDLVFTSRPGLLQDLCDRAGEPWRHVGLATVHEGVPSITEVSRNRFDIRPLDRVVSGNNEVAIARVQPDRRSGAARAASWCRQHGRREQLYAWHDVMLAGLIATARHYAIPGEREAFHRAVEAAARVVGPRKGRSDVTSYTCAAFIAEGLERSGCPIEVELRVPRAGKERPDLTELIRGRTRPELRAGRPSTKEYAIVLYALLAGLVAAKTGGIGDPDTDPTQALDQFRWAMPGDLWRSPSIVERYLIVDRIVDGIVKGVVDRTVDGTVDGIVDRAGR